jgi:hypothetical protein
MTLAPSANSNVELLTGELKQFNNEDELYGYLDQLSHDVDGVSFLDKAKAAVNAWWVRAIVGIANADRFYGFDTEGGNGLNKTTTPVRLAQWFEEVGLTNSKQTHKARSAAKVWLTLRKEDFQQSCYELVEEYGISKLDVIARAPAEERIELLKLAGHTDQKSLSAIVTKINASEGVISHKLMEAEKERDKRAAYLATFEAGSRNTEKFRRAAEALNKANTSVESLQKKLASCAGAEGSASKGFVEANGREPAEAVVDTSAQDQVKAQYEALVKQNEQLVADMQKLQESKDNWEKMCRAADNKVKRMSGATREWENWDWGRRMDLINVYITRFAESAGMFNFCQGDVDDSARRALVSPEARFKAHEERAIQAISMWVDVLSVEGVQELRNALENRGDLPPVEFVDSRELVTIDV